MRVDTFACVYPLKDLSGTRLNNLQALLSGFHRERLDILRGEFLYLGKEYIYPGGKPTFKGNIYRLGYFFGSKRSLYIFEISDVRLPYIFPRHPSLGYIILEF